MQVQAQRGGLQAEKGDRLTQVVGEVVVGAVLSVSPSVESAVVGLTRLAGTLRDSSHLHGLVAYLASINAELISITPVIPTDDPRSTS